MRTFHDGSLHSAMLKFCDLCWLVSDVDGRDEHCWPRTCLMLGRELFWDGDGTTPPDEPSPQMVLDSEKLHVCKVQH